MARRLSRLRLITNAALGRSEFMGDFPAEPESALGEDFLLTPHSDPVRNPADGRTPKGLHETPMEFLGFKGIDARGGRC